MRSRMSGAVFVGLMVAASVLSWPWLPESIPTHWNFQGEVDGRMPKWPGAFLTPAIGLAVWLLLPLLRRLDPRRENYERFDETFWLVVNVLLGFVLAMHLLTLAAALGLVVDVTRWLLVLLGVMLVLLGNYLPRMRSNWWMGIRTPWTLESDSVWRATHRLAGWTFVLAGIVTLFSALLPAGTRFWIALAAIMIAPLIPAVYSYFAWRKERREQRV